MKLSNPKKVVEAIHVLSGSPQIFTLYLSQFRDVFEEIQQDAQGTPIDVVLNGDWAMVQFSRLCTHRIRVLQDPSSNRISRSLLKVFSRKMILTEDDFEFASLYAKFYGARTRLSFGSFLLEEISTNWFPLILTLLISWVVFRSLAVASSPMGGKALEKVNELLLTTGTLYISIFILFTVSQNADALKDPHLFREGLTHRFLRVDRILAFLTIIVVCISILNIVLLNAPSPISLSLFGKTRTIQDVSIVVPVLSAIGITIFVDCFLALVQYYFRRVRYILERELTKDLLDAMWEERNTQPRD